MTRLARIFLAAIVCVVCSAANAQGPAFSVNREDQAKLGIETAPLAAATVEASAPAFIRVLDPAALGALDSDLAAAAAAAEASRKESERLMRLTAADASVSRQSAEAASAKAAADEAQARSLARRLSVEWGPALTGMSPEARSALIDDLIAGKAALMRADVLGDAGAAAAHAVTIFIGEGAPSTAAAIGRAGAVDAKMRTVGVLALLTGENAILAAPGAAFDGRVIGGGELSGVVIPRSAIVRLDGGDWVYLQNGPEEFERREISGAVKTKDGWFVAAGFTAGEKIVVSGAGSLLGVERADESAEAD